MTVLLNFVMLLNYIQNSIDENVTDKANGEFYQYVEAVKILTEVRRNYMTFEEYVYYREQDAKMEGKIEGKLESRIEDIMEILENYSDSLRERISAETDVEVLKSWLKIAAKCGSIEEFCKMAKIQIRYH